MHLSIRHLLDDLSGHVREQPRCSSHTACSHPASTLPDLTRPLANGDRWATLLAPPGGIGGEQPMQWLDFLQIIPNANAESLYVVFLVRFVIWE